MKNLLLIIEFLIIATLFSCGGGEEYKEEGIPSQISSQDCLKCHGSDIVDTHYDDTSTAQIEGYVLDNEVSWAPQGTGYVIKGSENACYGSCHNYHKTEPRIIRQWYSSGHADITKPAFTSNFTSGVCLRCHSGIGYANYIGTGNINYPDWNAPTTEISAHHITCNACHDAQGYPDSENKRLRKTGEIKLLSGAGSTLVSDATFDAGPSATCITCHQALESGWSLYKTMIGKGVNPYDSDDEIINNLTFVNPHYLPAGAMLFSFKGYEFSGNEFGKNFAGHYSRGIFQHQVMSCTGCHMADSEDDELGGHTFLMKRGTKKNIAVCQGCHPGLQDFNVYGRKEALEILKSQIITELARSGRGNGEGIFYNPDLYPYFFRTSDPQQQKFTNRVTTWKESELIAAFNLQFVNKEPGAYVHNYPYAAQLLYDSLMGLGVTPSIPRPSRNDRSAIIYQ
jgi:hypothetical protein